MRTPATIGLLLAALIVAAGCQTAQKEVNLVKKPSNYQQVRDIPIPKGFVFKSSESSLYSGSFRHAELVYMRRNFRKLEPVVRFFKDHMAKAGWELTWQYGTPQEPKLIFTKGFDQCEILVHIKESMGEEEPFTVARIVLGPSST